MSIADDNELAAISANENHGRQQRSLHHVWHPCTQMQRAQRIPPLPIARGEGPWLEDYEGKRYFDATSCDEKRSRP